ncbi:MAG: hypothetical protein MMC33_003121 [Icmadophila ericetorum]|nr:hypothetical protein [Icmadophila ericetorum]
MSTPRRQSSRLRGARNRRMPGQFDSNNLSFLLERDETPQSNAGIDAIIMSPPPPNKSLINESTEISPDSPFRTPDTLRTMSPPMEEMHPGMIHRSTTKQPDSGLRFGFIDVKQVAIRVPTPSNFAIALEDSDSPVKKVAPAPQQLISPQFTRFSSPEFDFRLTSPNQKLSSETQKIMDNVREEAARIKAVMIEEREKQDRMDGEASILFGEGRKVAKPKGKAGRYSEIHKQEFRKMDSIAGHVSAWKTKFQNNPTLLKRTKSKAGFDNPESSKAKHAMVEEDSGRLENCAPGKRVKVNFGDDASSARPITRGKDSEHESMPPPRSIPQPKSKLPSCATTPTKSSLARSASVKSFQASKLPTLGRSKSTKELAGPSAPKQPIGSKPSNLPRFGSMKSLFNRPQAKVFDGPIKAASIGNLPHPRTAGKLESQTPTFAATPTQATFSSPLGKEISFDTEMKAREELLVDSPSPARTISDPIQYPTIPSPGPLSSNPTKPGDFTFRSPHKLGLGIAGLNGPNKGTPRGTPKSPTIRQVRPSGISTPLSPFSNLPAIPHGLPNKKRAHSEVDNDEDQENIEPGDMSAASQEGGPKTKKYKTGKVETPLAIKDVKKTGRLTKAPNAAAPAQKPKAKSFMSLSRLNMLARPKNRG